MGIVFDQSLNTTDSPTFNSLKTDTILSDAANLSVSNRMTINAGHQTNLAVMTLNCAAGTGGLKLQNGSRSFQIGNNLNHTRPHFVRITNIGLRFSHGGAVSNGEAPFLFSGDLNSANSTSAVIGITTGGDGGLLEGLNSSGVRTSLLRSDGSFESYNTYTDASNYERGVFKWDGNILKIGTESAGTGSSRSIQLLPESGYLYIPAATGSAQIQKFGSGTKITADNGLYIDGYNGVLDFKTNTRTSDSPITFSQGWNNAAVAFTAMKLNVTDTASASGSTLMDLQVDGASVFKVDVDDHIVLTGLTSSTEDYIKINRLNGSNVLVISSSGSGNTQLQGDRNFEIETDTVDGTVILGNQNSRSFLKGSEGRATIGYQGSVHDSTTLSLRDTQKLRALQLTTLGRTVTTTKGQSSIGRRQRIPSR